MSTTNDATPYYKKATTILFGLSLLGLIIYLGRDIIVPFSFSILLAILLLPSVSFLERKKVPKVLAIIVVLIFAMILIAALLYFMTTQMMSFADDLPTIRQHLQDHYLTLQRWIREQFNLTVREQKKLIQDATVKMKDSTPGYIGGAFLSVTQSIMLIVLLPIYTFLMLYYRDMIKKFLVSVFESRHEEKVREVLRESRSIIQNYMIGLMIETASVAALNSLGFIILGIQYPIFLGVLAAILNLIPYIGGLIAVVFCMLVTVTNTDEISMVIWVAVVLGIVQLIDNNFLMPKIVGSKVKLNALMTIVAVLIGGALCGVSGMFLAIPGVAILKVVFDRVEELQPWGNLLGDDITVFEQNPIIKKFTKVGRRKPQKKAS
ncbi:MAG: AI-2E family transporter [Bacteroidetes bacterium]|nr:MAG: AI-2E family transporter [Bacteroidota bacterium]